jgi:photosystem II stability/assembly factor-like uncharacterized protein
MVLFWGFLLAIFLLARPAIGGTDSWTIQDPEGRRIQAVATDPDSPGTAFVGNEKGEVMKTTTGGAVWLLTGEIPEKEITALTVDFHSAGFIYAGTPNGIYRSANQGTSWVEANAGLTNLSITALLDDLNTVNIVYAGTQGGGVFRSFDAGESWLASPDTRGMIINGLAVDPFLTGEVYAATTTGLLISPDNGVTWSPSNTGFLPTEMNISSIMASPHEPDVLFAAALNRIYKSMDGGATWARLPVAMPRIVTDLAIDPNPAMLRTIYAAAAGSGIYKSSDGGLRWIAFGPDRALDSKAPFVNRISLDYSMPPIIFAGTEAGVFDYQYSFPPAAAFRAVPAGGSAPLKILFQNTSTGYISQYKWKFGDGTSSGAVSSSHLFINPGAYKVTLTVTGPGGTSSKTYTVKVLAPAPPTVSIKATDTVAVEGSKNNAVLTVSRTGSTASALDVQYAIRGTAKNKVDYKPLSGTVTIPQGLSSVRIIVIARKDAVAEPDESVNLLLKANSAYVVGLPKVAIAVIRGNR